ncbi:serine protease [Shigella boydii]|nr:serine protease [Shigella boydii]
MKKTIALVFAVSLAVFELVGCDRVEPGNVGIKVNKLGDDKGVGEVVGVGRYWTGWNTEVYIFPTFKQMKT